MSGWILLCANRRCSDANFTFLACLLRLEARICINYRPFFVHFMCSIGLTLWLSSGERQQQSFRVPFCGSRRFRRSVGRFSQACGGIDCGGFTRSVSSRSECNTTLSYLPPPLLLSLQFSVAGRAWLLYKVPPQAGDLSMVVACVPPTVTNPARNQSNQTNPTDARRRRTPGHGTCPETDAPSASRVLPRQMALSVCQRSRLERNTLACNFACRESPGFGEKSIYSGPATSRPEQL